MADDLANEAIFPGNRFAFEALKAELATGRLVAFVGSGVSIPLAPSWTGLLSDLIKRGLKEGLIQPADEAVLRELVHDDPLELASTLEESLSAAKYRSYLGDYFRLNNESTTSQDSIVKLPLQGIFTLNYDDGLSTAYVRHWHRMPRIIHPDNRNELRRWSLDRTSSAEPYPIIHWHGAANAPEKMILSADDYDKFYSVTDNRAFVEELWRSHHMLVIGFGFRDPILTRLAENVLRSVDSDNQHFALIGRRETDEITPLMRKQFARKFRVNPIFYQIIMNDDGTEDHSNLSDILLALTDSQPVKVNSGASNALVDQNVGIRGTAENEFKGGLFVGPSGQVLYAEPRIIAECEETQSASPEVIQISLADLVGSAHHAVITAPLEAGGTTLAKRIVVDLLRCGYDAFYRDAVKIGSHKKKILEDSIFKTDVRRAGTKSALVIDGFDAASHERMIKEVFGLRSFDKIIVIAKARMNDVVNLRDLNLGDNVKSYRLELLDRSDVRSIASQLFDTFDGDLISAAVEKTYNDLLELCIPLTPSNVIMYMIVVHREGSFTPLNRLHIMDRFIRDMLHRPSDMYRDAFNADNKLDIVGGFIYHLYNRGRPTFTKSDWDNYCLREMKESVIWFDHETLLADIEASRLVVRVGTSFRLKYKLFYSYFVGKHVADRPLLLVDFLKEGNHLSLDSLVEIIAGSSKDNTAIVTDLIDRLEAAIETFESRYELNEFDPYQHLEWPISPTDKTKLWSAVSEKLAEGPATSAEVDKLKRSIVAEIRTNDQNVVIRDLSDLQRSVSYLQSELIAALRESQKLNGELKTRSLRGIYKSYHIAMQIGFLFAPKIATRRFFLWNSIGFYNYMNWPGYAEMSEDRKVASVASVIPRALANRAADELGSRKLGALFEQVASRLKSSDFNLLLTYVLLLRSKPANWESAAKDILRVAGRTSVYLKYILDYTMMQFNQEVNTSNDRTKLKRLVAIIEAKREIKGANPSSSAVDQAYRRLELTNFFKRSQKARDDYSASLVPQPVRESKVAPEFKPVDIAKGPAILAEPEEDVFKRFGLSKPDGE